MKTTAKGFLLGGIIVFLLFLTTLLKSQSCTPFSVPYPDMGINFADPYNLPWVNLYHQANPWHSNYNNGCQIGADGWPTAGRDHRFVIAGDVSIVITIPAGSIIKVSFKGTYDQFFETDGACSIVAGSQRNNYPKAGYAYLEVLVSEAIVPSDQTGKKDIYAFNFHNHVEDVKFMRPGFEIDDNTIIHPDYTNLLKPYSTFRFMGYLSSNTHGVDDQYACNGPGSIDWSYRMHKNAPQTFGPYWNKGASWEYAIELCNEFDKNMWINVPLIASNQYVTELAKLIKDNLKPKLNVYIEIGNETWNSAGGFCCFRQIQNHHCGNDWDCHQQLPARLLKNVVDQFAAVWGNDQINNRIRGVLCGQIGYASDGHGWTIHAGLQWMVDNGFDPHDYFYAVGAAPYFGPEGVNSSVDAMIAACTHDINETIFGEFSNEYHPQSDQYMGNKLEGWLGEAGQYGLKLMCYEGGPDMDYTTGSGGIKDLVNRDPRMKDLCINYWTKWYSRYGYNALFNFFLAGIGTSGLYTLTESFYTSSTRQQAHNYLLSNPSPPFDTTIRQIIPAVLDARKVACYWSGWNREPALLYKRGELQQPNWHPSDKWSMAAVKNGKYRFAVEQQAGKETDIDVFMDGVLMKNIRIPSTGGAWQWSDAQNVYIDMDLSYGIHVMRFDYRRWTDCNVRKLKFTLISETPPFQPGNITGDVDACLGNPKAMYTVDIDRSVCEYEWEVTGGSILPPTGGGGAAISGQGTNLIYVSWSGVPAGTYSIRVRGKNDVGTSAWRTAAITLAPCGFTANPNPVCTSTPVTFTPAVSGTITEWNWNFGAGASPSTSTVQSPPTVSYSSEGSKSVKLIVKNNLGQTLTFTNEMIVGRTVAGTTTATPSTVNAGSSSSINLSGAIGSVVNWEYSTDNVSWTPISSVQLPLNTGALALSTWYRAVVKADGCTELRSTPVRVVVNNPVNPGIISPASSSICGGNGPLLTLSGNNGTILRWEKKPAVGNWMSIAGATGATYTPTTITETTSFRVIVNIGGTEYPSQMATIDISGTSVAGTASANPTQVCSGNTSVLSLASSSGNIQWQSSANGTSGWTNISGATNASYTTAALTATTYYRAVVGGGSCPSVNSNIISVTIGSPITAGTAAASPTQVCTGNTTNLSLTGSTGTIQWQQSANGTSGWTDINGATTANYTTAALTTATYFRAVVSGGGCAAVNSNSVAVAITTASVPGTASANPTQVCTGNTTMLSLAGNTGTIQWQSSANGTSGWTNISGATSASYTSGALTTGIYYRAVVSSGSCTSANSNAVQITIGSAAVAGTITGAANFCVGGTVPQLTLGGSTGNIQWQSSTDGTTFTDVTGATSTPYTPTLFTGSKWFRANVSQTGCGVATSASVRMDALAAPLGGSVNATNTTIAAGTSPGVLTLSGNGGNVVKWQYAQTPFIPITWKDTFVTTTTLTSPALLIPTRFRAVVNNGVCSDVNSNYIEITVVPYNGGAISGGTTVCYGTSGNVLNLSGHNGTILTWQSSTDPLAGRTNVAGTAGATTYTTPALFRTTWYWAVIQDINGQLFSTPDSIVVKDQPNAGTITASATNIAINSSVTLNSGTITGNIISWESRTMTGSWTVVPGSAGLASISSGNLSETTLFRMVVGNSPCTNALSNELVINVFDVKVGTLSANAFDICAGTQVSLALNNSTGTVVSWENAAVIGSWGNIINTDSIYSATPSVTTYYRVKVRMPDNSEVYSNMVTISVSTPPVAGNFVYTPNVCAGNDAGIIRIENNTGTVSDWESSTDGTTWNPLSQTGSTYNTGIINTTTQYRVKLVNGVCPIITTTPAVINVLPGPRSDLTVTGSTVCAGGNATVTVTAKQIGVLYSLQTLMGLAVVSTVDSSGVDVIFTLNNVSADASYRIQAGSSGCSATLSNFANITVVPLVIPQFSGPADACPGDTSLIYSVVQQTNHTYSLTIDGGTITDQSSLSSIKVLWTSPQGSLTVKDSSTIGCVTSKTISVNSIDAQAPTILCKPDVEIKTLLDSIHNDQFIYVEPDRELEPSILDNCGVSSLINDFNQLDSLIGQQIVFNIQDALEYTQAIKWTVEDRSGLTASCVIKVILKIDADINPFSAFSPNKDDVNDYWEIKNISKYPDATVQVFNRWGQMIFESKNSYESNKWKGDNLPIDSYHYKITQNGKILKRGIVTIVK